MLLLLLAAAVPACAGCHPKESASHAAAPMAKTLFRAADSQILKANPALEVRRDGYVWKVRNGVYSVSDGKNTLNTPIQWAFGFGNLGQTWVFERNGVLRESTVSYYTSQKGLEITPGHIDLPRRNLDEAFGRPIDPSEVRRCFGCHSTGTLPDPTPGVQCEQCHKGALKHAADLSTMPKLGKLSTDEISTLCGACHRTWEEVAVMGPHDAQNVRFQPYRLANSKCYDGSDKRIACTACHDPHSAKPPTPKVATTTKINVDAQCRSCHGAPAISHAVKKTCPVAKSNCASCHMPAVEIPGIHSKFRDHWIRIARPGTPYPD